MKCYVSVYSMHAVYQFGEWVWSHKKILLAVLIKLINTHSSDIVIQIVLSQLVYDEGTMHMIYHYFVPKM